ncbi:hypothetical protein PBCV1_a588R [Paramecium bursaria Chlorella virus 1]|uniref:Uncharacterized protein n=1 Tax=Paramecium bursaria Chlorella virus 1 TaxID=10506 RepID=O41070_PBCV1|nr:hypothetical protein PBCV1_a588R [Paramecium bursaria Chlorella virus 1]AAC97014.1 hypothetical protein [Paramecium bursaria Chlorella virus 1]
MSASASNDTINKTDRGELIAARNGNVPILWRVLERTFRLCFVANIQTKVILRVLYFQSLTIQHHLYFIEHSRHVVNTTNHNRHCVIVKRINTETLKVREKSCRDVRILRTRSYLWL